jgi:23S rRNA (adenine1618-N6)-methyltransferase
VMCNPPFHTSAKEAAAGALRKWKNLGKNDGSPKHAASNPKLNFGGQPAELWCEGGEVGFVGRTVAESAAYHTQVAWFSALVSREESLPAIYAALKAVGAPRVETVDMAQGQKKSRIVAWRF